jgi:hypothetical protein
MPYYGAGDYYRGGDGNYAAGGIFSAIGKFLGGAAKTVVRASPIGGIVAAAGPSVFNMPVSSFGPGEIPARPAPGFGGAVSRFLPGGESGYLSTAGYHQIKHGPHAGKWVKNRHMNPLNPRALRRSGRRVKGFLKFASRMGALPLSRGKGKKLFQRKKR